MNNKYERITRRLIGRLLFAVIFCIGIFSVLAVFISRKNTETIETVGDVYMHGVSEEILLHFKSTVDSHFNLMTDLLAAADVRNPAKWNAKEWLSEGAELRGLSYLAYYTTDGELETIYGSDVELDDASAFFSALESGEKKVTSGLSSSDEQLLIMGLPYPEGTDDVDLALIMGLPVSSINDTLSLDVSDSPVYSHIIRMDGSFVIRNGTVSQDNYFDRIYGKINQDAEKYVSEMQQAMEKYEHYSAILDVDKEHRHIHVTKLDYADWFLVVVMPYSSVDVDISTLTKQLFYATCVCSVTVLLLLIWIFLSCFKALVEQMNELNRLRQEAVDANKSKSEFLSNMSHDIRTPMNAIVGMTSIATVNINDKEQVQNCLRKITISSKHLLSLINDVLDISKIESGKLTLAIDNVSLRDVIENVVTIIQPQVDAKGQRFDVVIHDIFTEDICCDSVRLNQVLINILGNAVKFTPEGGSIQFCVYEEVSKMDECICVHFVVEDTGIGMTPEFKEKIFESFVRADSKRVHRTEGSGLGMTITKYIIDAMDGVIEVQSELGKGSRFHIVLDLKKAQIQEKDMLLPNWKALVVDDDQQVCENTAATLKELGIDGDWALDAESAMEMIAERDGQAEEYRILLVDWKLPGMDGVKFAAEIRARYGLEIPILLITAYDWSGIEAEARDTGITGFISKPLFKSTLYYRLRPLLCGETESVDAAPMQNEMTEDFTGKRVLLAEDNELNWEIAKELLSCMGLELDWAENGQICLDKFKQSAFDYYDVILMDVRMPVMSGHEAAKAIRALNRSDARTIPIIAMTADAFVEDIQECLDNGMNAHIAKPVDTKELAQVLKKHLR